MIPNISKIIIFISIALQAKQFYLRKQKTENAITFVVFEQNKNLDVIYKIFTFYAIFESSLQLLLLAGFEFTNYKLNHYLDFIIKTRGIALTIVDIIFKIILSVIYYHST